VRRVKVTAGPSKGKLGWAHSEAFDPYHGLVTVDGDATPKAFFNPGSLTDVAPPPPPPPENTVEFEFSDFSGWYIGNAAEGYPTPRIVTLPSEGVAARTQDLTAARFEATSTLIHAKAYRDFTYAEIDGKTVTQWLWWPSISTFPTWSGQPPIFHQFKHRHSMSTGDSTPLCWVIGAPPLERAYLNAETQWQLSFPIPRDRWFPVSTVVRVGGESVFLADGQEFGRTRTITGGSSDSRLTFGIGSYGNMRGPLYVDAVDIS
jgi:hypothetical protein